MPAPEASRAAALALVLALPAAAAEQDCAPDVLDLRDVDFNAPL